MTSMVPSPSAARMASRSSGSRSGGFIFALVLYPSHALVRQREVMGTGFGGDPEPCSFARRINATEPRVDM